MTSSITLITLGTNSISSISMEDAAVLTSKSLALKTVSQESLSLMEHSNVDLPIVKVKNKESMLSETTKMSSMK